MFRQHDESVDMKWMTLACAARRFAQRLDLVGQKRAAAIEQIGGEEPAASGDKRATIVRHTCKVADSERGAIKRLRPTRMAALGAITLLRLRLFKIHFGCGISPKGRNKVIAPY